MLNGRDNVWGRKPGTLAMLLGVAGTVFASFMLAIVSVQRAAFASVRADPEHEAELGAFRELIATLHAMFLLHMPNWIVIGLVLAVLGHAVRRGFASSARRLRLASGVALVALVAYIGHVVFGVLPRFAALFDRWSVESAVVWVLGTGGALFALVFAAPFAWIIHRLAPTTPDRQP